MNKSNGVFFTFIFIVVLMTWKVAVATPTNDNFSDATVLSGDNGRMTISNMGATSEPNEPNHDGEASVAYASIWFKWVAPFSTFVNFYTTASSDGSYFDTALAAYTGASVNSLSQLAVNDDKNDSNLMSDISFNTVAGSTYYIAVDGFEGDYGLVDLVWRAEPPASPPPANRDVTPMLSLLLAGGATMGERNLSLALMVAKDTDKIEMAWIPGSDGKTPVEDIKYKIYLSTSKDFTPSEATLKKTVKGGSQTELTGLTADTLYYGKIVAEYADSTSAPSNGLQSKTYKYKVLVSTSTTIENAVDLGLGKHTTTNGTTYTYPGGTPPTPGSILLSEDIAGGITLRTVDSTSTSVDGTVTVYTSDGSLTDVLDTGSIYSSFQLFDVAAESKNLSGSSTKIATAKSVTLKDGSQQTQMNWKDRLLTATQTTYAYDRKALKVIPKGNTSIIKIMKPKAVKESFTASVTAEFEPELITTAEWGGLIPKRLDSAKVAAKGTLSLTALAQYEFASSGSVDKDFQLFKRTWVSAYPIPGPIPYVYQEITLYVDVEASASASAEIKAEAKAILSEEVEVGATYDGSTWTPYITHGESDSLTASLNIVGGANAEIRVIPKIEVAFYTVVSSSLTVEPFAKSSLTFGETTNNVDFIAANPEHLVQLTSFDASLEMESNVSVALSVLGRSWDILSPTCVLGTTGCAYEFSPIDLFSIPQLALSTTSSTDSQTDFQLQITDGVNNPFDIGSIKWEAYPDDGTITTGNCWRSDSTTSCTATFQPGDAAEYTMFASGYGILGETGRQYANIIDGSTNNGFNCSYESFSKYESTDGIGYTYYCRTSDDNVYNFTERASMLILQYTTSDIEYSVYIEPISSLRKIPRSYDVSILNTDVTNEISRHWRCLSDSTFTATGFNLCENCDNDDSGYYRDVIILEDYNTKEITYTSCAPTCADTNQEWEDQAFNECFNKIDELINPTPFSGVVPFLYKGSCHEWWDHYDENGNWVECSY